MDQSNSFTTVVLYMAQLKMILDSGIPEADEYLESVIQACVIARESTTNITNLWSDAILALQDRDVVTALDCMGKIANGGK